MQVIPVDKMIECETKLKKWGNSIGFIIPKQEVEKENLHPDQIVKAIIKPKEVVKVKDIFGRLKFKKSTEQIMKEIRNELDSKFFK